MSSKDPWRQIIIQRLNERKTREQKPFEEIIGLTGKLYESIDCLRNENIRLSLQKEQIQSELQRLTGAAGSPDASTPSLTNRASLPFFSAAPAGSSLDDQRKILSLQEELTELHRRKGENAQQIVELRNLVDEKDKEIRSWKIKYQDAIVSLDQYKSTSEKLQSRIIELEEKSQILLDEHTALQMAYTALESKSLVTERDFSVLLGRYQKIVTRDVELLNQTNEVEAARLRERQKLELAEAIKEMPTGEAVTRDAMPGMRVPEQDNDPLCLVCVLPAKKIFEFEAHDAEVNAVKWCPDMDSRSILLTGGGDRKVKLWEVTVGRGEVSCRTTFTGSNAAITSIDVDNEMVLASSNDFASRVWTLDGKLRRTLTGHSNKVLAVKFLSSANRVVSGSHDRTLKIWDLNRHACTRTLFAGSSCNDLVVASGSSDSGSIISGHFDKRIRFWETRTESTCNEILLEGKITSLALSPNSFNLLACVRDDTLKQLDLRMNKIVTTFIADGFKVGCDWTRAVFSPDNEYVAAGSSDGAIFIWNLASGKVETILKDQHHGHNVITCAWNRSGRIFISCDKGKRGVVWTD